MVVEILTKAIKVSLNFYLKVYVELKVGVYNTLKILFVI
jgi:hypothetical protein